MKKKEKVKDFTPEDRINSELARMKHRDLQRACIVRGLDFESISGFSHHQLASWFYKNYDNGEDNQKLIEFDLWMEGELQKRGHKKGDAILSACFRFSFIPPDDEINTRVVPTKEKPAIKAPVIDDKPKRKKDETLGVTTGTKKHLTYTLSQQGVSLEETQKKVLAAFPEANDRSIAIWYKNAKKLKDAANN